MILSLNVPSAVFLARPLTLVCPDLYPKKLCSGSGKTPGFLPSIHSSGFFLLTTISLTFESFSSSYFSLFPIFFSRTSSPANKTIPLPAHQPFLPLVFHYFFVDRLKNRFPTLRGRVISFPVTRGFSSPFHILPLSFMKKAAFSLFQNPVPPRFLLFFLGTPLPLVSLSERKGPPTIEGSPISPITLFLHKTPTQPNQPLPRLPPPGNFSVAPNRRHLCRRTR